MNIDAALSSYQETIAFYLRQDVSCALWELSNRRPLKFHYHSDTDFRPHGAKAKTATFHCLPTVEDFRRHIIELTRHITSCGWPFFPFWNMHHAANAPSQPDHPVGWDMRFELDFDLESSFQTVIPVLAVLEHVGVPALAKYSGRRSLHLSIPAEAFPSHMRANPDHKAWTHTMETLGRLLCRLAPALGKNGGAHQAKELVLTAPYSLHRYHGRISLPLTLAQAMTFDPASAALADFAGVQWHPADMEDRDDRMLPLLDLAARSLHDPDVALRLAEDVFRGPRWTTFSHATRPDDARNDPVLAALLSGAPGIHHPDLQPLPEHVRARLRLALQRIDDPDAKDWKFYCMTGGRGFNVDLDRWRHFRRTVAAFLALWVSAGLDAALHHLFEMLAGPQDGPQAALAVRLLWLLPEPPDHLVAALEAHWRTAATPPSSAFVALALALLALPCPRALDLLAGDSDPAEAAPLRDLLLQAGPWRVEQRPDLAVAALSLAFGSPAVHSWSADPTAPHARTMISSVFGPFRLDAERWQAKNLDKFRHALARVRQLPPSASMTSPESKPVRPEPPGRPDRPGL